MRSFCDEVAEPGRLARGRRPRGLLLCARPARRSATASAPAAAPAGDPCRCCSAGSNAQPPRRRRAAAVAAADRGQRRTPCRSRSLRDRNGEDGLALALEQRESVRNDGLIAIKATFDDVASTSLNCFGGRSRNANVAGSALDSHVRYLDAANSRLPAGVPVKSSPAAPFCVMTFLPQIFTSASGQARHRAAVAGPRRQRLARSRRGMRWAGAAIGAGVPVGRPSACVRRFGRGRRGQAWRRRQSRVSCRCWSGVGVGVVVGPASRLGVVALRRGPRHRWLRRDTAPGRPGTGPADAGAFCPSPGRPSDTIGPLNRRVSTCTTARGARIVPCQAVFGWRSTSVASARLQHPAPRFVAPQLGQARLLELLYVGRPVRDHAYAHTVSLETMCSLRRLQRRRTETHVDAGILALRPTVTPQQREHVARRVRALERCSGAATAVRRPSWFGSSVARCGRADRAAPSAPTSNGVRRRGYLWFAAGSVRVPREVLDEAGGAAVIDAGADVLQATLDPEARNPLRRRPDSSMLCRKLLQRRVLLDDDSAPRSRCSSGRGHR